MKPHQAAPEPLASTGVSASRRALLKAGWIAPVVVAISLPRSSYAKGMSRSRSFPRKPKPPKTPPGKR